MHSQIETKQKNDDLIVLKSWEDNLSVQGSESIKSLQNRIEKLSDQIKDANVSGLVKAAGYTKAIVFFIKYKLTEIPFLFMLYVYRAGVYLRLNKKNEMRRDLEKISQLINASYKGGHVFIHYVAVIKLCIDHEYYEPALFFHSNWAKPLKAELGLEKYIETLLNCCDTRIDLYTKRSQYSKVIDCCFFITKMLSGEIRNVETLGDKNSGRRLRNYLLIFKKRHLAIQTLAKQNAALQQNLRNYRSPINEEDIFTSEAENQSVKSKRKKPKKRKSKNSAAQAQAETKVQQQETTVIVQQQLYSAQGNISKTNKQCDVNQNTSEVTQAPVETQEIRDEKVPGLVNATPSPAMTSSPASSESIPSSPALPAEAKNNLTSRFFPPALETSNAQVTFSDLTLPDSKEKEEDKNAKFKKINARLQELFVPGDMEKNYINLFEGGIIYKFFPMLADYLRDDKFLEKLQEIDKMGDSNRSSLNYVYALFIAQAESSYSQRIPPDLSLENIFSKTPLVRVNYESYCDHLINRKIKLPSSPEFYYAELFLKEARVDLGAQPEVVDTVIPTARKL